MDDSPPLNKVRNRYRRDATRQLYELGWTTGEIAFLLGVSDRQVKRDLAYFRRVEQRLRAMKANREALAARLA